MNLEEMMAKAAEAARALQAQMEGAQAALDSIAVEGVAGAGMVTVRATARGRLTGVEIDPSLLSPDSKEMLEDLLVAAFNDARAKADAAGQAEMAKMTAGLPLPPGFKLPF
jgi:DNA-binding YbaB/EbfC family protein